MSSLQISTRLSWLHKWLDSLQEALPESQALIHAWRENLRGMETRLQESRLRIAVVGTVKSGKSTWVNAWLGEDLVRRGAGILTSAVTRIRSGTEFQADLELRTAEDVLEELNRTAQRLARLLGQEWPSAPSLASAMGRLPDLLSQGERAGGAPQPEVRLLQHLLRGYPSVREQLCVHKAPLRWSGAEALQHRDWVSRDETAVFLEGVLLRSPRLAQGLELADCQGSDSPNPLHLLRVQEYLSQATAAIYVIGSRVGIRQADLHLLQVLKELGMLQRTVFVLNMDLSEHESLADLHRVRERVLEELCAWVEEPRLICVSALHALLRSQPETLEARLRLQLWEQVPELLEEHHQGWQRLQEVFAAWRRSQHEELHAAEARHLETLARHLELWLGQMLEEDRQEAATLSADPEFVENIRRSAEALLDQKLSLLRDSLQQEVRNQLTERHSGLAARLQNFTEQYQIPERLKAPERLGEILLQLPGALGLEAYQDFRQRQLRFLAEELNPPLLQHLQVLSESFRPGLEASRTALCSILSRGSGHSVEHLEALLTLPRFPELPPPRFSSSLEYGRSARMRSLVSLARQWIRERQPVDQGVVQSLERQLRQDALEALEFDLFNFQENLLHQYLWKGLQLMRSGFAQRVGEVAEMLLQEQQALRKQRQARQAREQQVAELRERLHQAFFGGALTD
ncbi:MAG: dynamin family protein [bacterium]